MRDFSERACAAPWGRHDADKDGIYVQVHRGYCAISTATRSQTETNREISMVSPDFSWYLP